MGFYRIPIRAAKIEAIPRVLQAIGFPVVKIEKQLDGITYSCANPKRPGRNWTFSITSETRVAPPYFTCGLSQLSRQIVHSLTVEGFFERNASERNSEK